jgi:hypothetical protein
MKITKKKLKQLVKEELYKLITEQTSGRPGSPSNPTRLPHMAVCGRGMVWDPEYEECVQSGEAGEEVTSAGEVEYSSAAGLSPETRRPAPGGEWVAQTTMKSYERPNVLAGRPGETTKKDMEKLASGGASEEEIKHMKKLDKLDPGPRGLRHRHKLNAAALKQAVADAGKKDYRGLPRNHWARKLYRISYRALKKKRELKRAAAAAEAYDPIRGGVARRSAAAKRSRERPAAAAQKPTKGWWEKTFGRKGL